MGRLHDLLAENGVECWFAPESLKIGDQFPTSIEDALNKFAKVLLVVSDESVKSDWVRKEVEICLRRERTGNSLIIYPIRLDDSITGTSESWVASIPQYEISAISETFVDGPNRKNSKKNLDVCSTACGCDEIEVSQRSSVCDAKAPWRNLALT